MLSNIKTEYTANVIELSVQCLKCRLECLKVGKPQGIKCITFIFISRRWLDEKRFITGR